MTTDIDRGGRAREVSGAQLTPADLASRLLGTVLLGVFALWLVITAVHVPAQFASAIVVGINNGALYALIALGYTLVYGIIELINFSHGDLFMLVTIVAAAVIVTVFGATSAELRRDRCWSRSLSW